MRITLRYTILMLIMLFPVSLMGQARYALLIGIGNYPEESGWNTIHGNNDISIINDALLRQGFQEQNIIQLKDSIATKQNIIAAFIILQDKCQNGDIAYIHFSGHGQQVTDLNGDEGDGYDESWIPYDACKTYEPGKYEGQNHLVDDELNSYLTRLRARVGSKGKIVVVADACHSGSGSRGQSDEEVFIRGSKERFIIPNVNQTNKVKSEPTEWLFIAACKPYQSNYEHRTKDGTYYGVLSYVIANDDKNFRDCNYADMLKEWSGTVSGLSKYPQELDGEGQPSRNNSYMF